MDDAHTEDAALAQLFALLSKPEVGQTLQAIRQIADFDIPVEHRAVFTRFHEFITEPQPSYVTAWRAEPRLEKWYHWHVNGVLGDVRGALAAAHYHQSNLANLETDLYAAIKKINVFDQLQSAGIGGGGTRKLDFEYQSFVLACRRSLDYLAGGLAAFFKTECYNFRKLPNSLKPRDPCAVADAIKQAHARHVGNLDFIMAEGRRSVRNRIAHYEFVSAGTININAQGLMLAGGGEEMGFSHANPKAQLKDILAKRLANLHACVDDMIDCFIASVSVTPEGKSGLGSSET